ncbi:MAG TPA: serine/threonine-protein kinase [Myxococcaceae bacterium]|nr:serine/threonine-protein kinase [Myxococcaceae bacterium]
MASTPATSAPDPLLGTTVGSFRLVRRIGHGGMGSVYLGEQTLIGSKVAVKMLHEHLASDASLVQRFYAEARAVNLIGHPNIVNIFDMNVVPPRRYYLIMEYLEGEPLSAAPAGPMPPEQALPILIQVCQALQAAHARGVVHRDLKPENIYLCRRDGPPFVKILDFGIAKLFGGETQEGQTHAGWIVGTPEYMAPEQGSGEALDGRADLYALGVIAYRLATGRLPFSGGGVTGILLAHRDTPPTAPRDLNPRLSQAWSDAILGALAKRREDRFPDADAFRAALERALTRSAASSGPLSSRAGPVASEPTPRVPTPHVTHAPAPSSPVPTPVTFRGTIILDGAARAVDLRDLSRAGVYACLPEPLPALFTRVQVSLENPPGALTRAEVVRQVPELQARAWGFAAGVALQFLEPAPPFKEAVSRRMKGLAPLTPKGAENPEFERILTRARTAPADPYARLGLGQDAEFDDIRSRWRELRTELEGVQTRGATPRQQDEARRLLLKLAESVERIATPARRVETDAEAGNFRGVARCLSAGLTVTVLEQHRARFLATHPGAEARAHLQAAAARGFESSGHRAQALEAYERALELDPLNLGLQQRFWALRQRGGA